jgi:colanic acid/amylovoran biosynthesis glycosyltransferase
MRSNSYAPDAPLRIAYLNTQYPSLSHTFIEREIRAVRALGVHIETFSVRRPGVNARLGSTHEQAAKETFFILDGLVPMALSALQALAASPAGFLRALVASQRLAPPGMKARLYHVVYAFEGMRLACEIRRRGLGHVHVHMANNGAAVAMMACRYNRSLTYSLSIHGPSDFYHVDTLRLQLKVAGAMFVRCISSFCRAQIMAWSDSKAWSNYHVVHCGIDPTVYLPRPARQPGPLRLLAVGRLHRIKGYQLLLDAIAILASERRAVELEIIGDGPERVALEKQAELLGLHGIVIFSGAVSQDEIGRHYDRADAMVVSSFNEGVPVVLMEACAKELGVIATCVGGIPELIEQGVNGYIVSAGSAEALEAPIRLLAADPGLCRRHGEAGRRRVLEEYSVEKLGAGMVELFSRYLGDDRHQALQALSSTLRHKN